MKWGNNTMCDSVSSGGFPPSKLDELQYIEKATEEVRLMMMMTLESKSITHLYIMKGMGFEGGHHFHKKCNFGYGGRVFSGGEKMSLPASCKLAN